LANTSYDTGYLKRWSPLLRTAQTTLVIQEGSQFILVAFMFWPAPMESGETSWKASNSAGGTAEMARSTAAAEFLRVFHVSGKGNPMTCDQYRASELRPQPR
jgi:hypothetical protein